MKVLGLDAETTGLDPKTHFLTEVGWVIFEDDWEVKKVGGSLIHNPKALPLSDEIVKLTGITNDLLVTDGAKLEEVLLELRDLEKKGYEAVVAHNLPFDKDFLEEAFKQEEMDPGDLFLKPWLCSNADVVEHEGKRCRKLSHMAVDYGLTVDGSKLHRAVDDVLLMGSVLRACGATADNMLAYKLDPWVYLQAETEKPWVDSGKSTDLAKAEGFSWERASGTYAPIFPKMWVKRIKSKNLEAEKAKQVGFKRKVIEAP